MSDMTNKGCFKDAVCIETQRIFDSCQDKDCLEDLEVVFTDEDDRKTIEHHFNLHFSRDFYLTILTNFQLRKSLLLLKLCHR